MAGLTAAIDLCQKGLEVCLIEKNEFPHHKVCGEYLSKEVEAYLESLEVNLEELHPKEISRMEFSSLSGKILKCDLEMGGWGISRYSLDHYLMRKALHVGCEIIQDIVEEVHFKNDLFTLKLNSGEKLTSEIVLGAFGKRSNLDKKLGREFIQKQSGWLAVKSHYKNQTHPEDLVSMHNFEGGYCGLSRTELNTVNVCYLASYKSFKKHKHPEAFRETVLRKNPKLNEFFEQSELAWEKELSIAQVSFDKKSLIKDHILMLGDSAGLIHPLCGNGMAMAIHSAKLASDCILAYFEDKKMNRAELENKYRKAWNYHFSSRLRSGRILQKILLNQRLSDLSQQFIKSVPGIMPHIIKQTHGKPLHV
ncbi:hypothetical protein GCM10023115_52360 [Pontixanthobacter gangjinensis]